MMDYRESCVGRLSRWAISLSFQNIFVCIQHYFLRLHGQQDLCRTATVSDYLDLVKTYHAIAEIGKDRHEHGKVLIHFTLRNRHLQHHLASISRGELIVE